MKNYFLIASVIFAKHLNAQQIVTDRPDQTEASSTVPKGSIQIESGVLIGFDESNSKRTRQILAPTTLFRYGLTKGIEIRVLNQFESMKNHAIDKESNGISDLEIGTKIQLVRNTNVNTELAFLSHLILPTGSRDLTNTNFGSINKFAISHNISQNIELGYNIGYNYFGSGKGDLTYSLSIAFGVTGKVGIYLEPYGELTELQKYQSNFDAGITYLVKDNFQLDFSFGTGINNTMNYISAGFSWNIQKS